MTENFLKKQLTVKSLLYVVLFFAIIMGVGYLVMEHNKTQVEKEFAEYRMNAESKQRYLSHTVNSLDEKYTNLYKNLDNLYELNWKNVSFWAEYYGVENKDAAMSQIAIESGNLTSNICLNYGNLVGMHYPRIRPTSANGYIIADGGVRVATYDYWWKSIEDYSLWQEYFDYDEEIHIDEYLTLLDNHGKSGYAEASNYIKAVRRHYEQFDLDELVN